jgi:hypothetical protein
MNLLKNYIKIFFPIIFLLWSHELLAQNRWVTSASLTRGLTGAAAVVVDTTIYVLGGYSDSTQSIVDWIQKFNPETGQFTYITQMKSRRVHLFAAVSDSNIYYTGGEQGLGHHASGIMECFNLRTGIVTAIDTNRRFNRFFMSGVVTDSMLYLVGGTPVDGTPPPGNNPYIIEFNLNKKEITYGYLGMFSNNSLRSGHVTMINNEFLFIFGGNYNTVLSEIYRYSLNNKVLHRVLPNMSVPRTNATAVRNNVDSELIIMGGFNEGNFALNSVEKIKFNDSSSLYFEPFPPMNYKRKNFNSVLSNGNIYVFGGMNENGQFLKPIEKYQLITSVKEEKELDNEALYQLYQNYPNPFNPSTSIEFRIQAESKVTLTIYDPLGSVVAVLLDDVIAPGIHKQIWNGSSVSSGIYFYELIVNKIDQSSTFLKTYRQVNKMILLK